MGVSALLANIAAGGGMATSNNYALEFTFPSGVSSVEGFGSRWGNLNTSDAKASNDEERMMLFCDEITLPGMQATTGQLTNVLPGSGVWYYPTGRMYNDTQLSFMCDANMTPVKKITDWMQYIFKSTDENKTVSLRYPDQYQATMRVRKTEKSKETDGGKYSLQYEFANIWPYSMDQIPLSYGSSQLVKFTVNFYYRKWTVNKIQLKEQDRK
jgi:hypothetical protein